MNIAIPLVEGRLATHFGHCDEFVLIEVDDDGPSVVKSERLPAPPHQPGLLPEWLQQHGADVIIAGGMGRRAQALFAQTGIEVVLGAVSDEPERIVEHYLAGKLETGDNPCDH